MPRLVCTLILSLCTHCAYADTQNATRQLQNEIDRSVWQPFQEAFQNMDGQALNALYAADVLRVTTAGIDTQGQFKLLNADRFTANKANGERIKLDFWFDSRHTNATTSYEVGFYRMRTTHRSGTSTNFYGQFHIVLKRTAGRWQITQDWDTGSIGGHAIEARDFNQRLPAVFSTHPKKSVDSSLSSTKDPA